MLSCARGSPEREIARCSEEAPGVEDDEGVQGQRAQLRRPRGWLPWGDVRRARGAPEGRCCDQAKKLTTGRHAEALAIKRRDRIKHERRAERYVPTVAGQALLERALGMQAEVAAAQRALRAFQDQAAGVVRVSAPEWVVARALVPVVAALAQRHPGVRTELVSEAARANLPAGEADIAIRARRFELPGTWQRVVGRVEFALYASRNYVRRYGRCLQPGAAGHRLICMDDGDGPIADVEWLNKVAGEASVVAKANGREVMSQLALEGCGIACLPRLIGDGQPRLVCLEGLGEAPPRRLWLGVHRDQRAVPRIRRVSTAIAERLVELLPLKRVT